MAKKPPFLLTAFRQKCPKCGKGDLFLYSNPYKLKTMHVMHARCPDCQVSFHQEPGFYWGAMFVSYALTSGLVFFNTIWIYLIFGWSMWAHLVINIGLIIILSPFSFRISRALWLSGTMRYIEKTA